MRATGGRDPALWTMLPDGSDMRQLTPSSGDMEVHPSWSPSGDRVAYSGRHDGVWKIWEVQADGTGLRRLTDGPPGAAIMVPAFSPDGRFIVFEGTEADGSTTVWRADAADGGNATRLTPADQSPSITDMGAKPSPDGQLLAFASDRGNAPGQYDVWLMEGWQQAPDGPGVRLHRLTAGANNTLSRSWAPDSRRLVLNSMRGGVGRICVADVPAAEAALDALAAPIDAARLLCLTNTTSTPNGPWSPGGMFPTVDGDATPAWSPDGSRIAFSSNRAGSFEIFSMAADGSDVRRLTFTPREDAAAGDQHVTVGWQRLALPAEAPAPAPAEAPVVSRAAPSEAPASAPASAAPARAARALGLLPLLLLQLVLAAAAAGIA